MKRNGSLVGASLALLLAAPPALAQDSTRANLAGTWTSGDRRLVIQSRSPGSSLDGYVVRNEAGDLIGRAAFDGRTLRIIDDAGMVRRLAGTDAKSDRAGYAYTGDALSGPDGKFVRTQTATRRAKHPSFGSRAQVAALVAQLEDAEGNRNGIPGDEQAKGWFGRSLDALGRNPLARRALAFFAPGLSTKDEVARIRKFVADREELWGHPATTLPGASDLFRAEKAIALARFGRTPDEVTEGFVLARGSVAGQRIADRKIFYQRWQPTGRPSGRLVVISPGFQETHRNFYEQIQLLNAQGDEVIVMDHQWAGQSEGSAGGLDRGFGVARDVAAVAAFANETSQGKRLVLFGNSMGAGPGVLGALTLNDNGLVQLEGPSMPRGLSAVLQAPFIEMTPNLLNKALAGASHVPLVNRVKMPALGLPPLSKDKAANAKAANEAVIDDIRAQTRTMTAANADVQEILSLIDQGKGPRGRIYVVHGSNDPLAHVEASRRLVAKLGARAKLQEIASPNHVLEESPSEQGYAIAGVRWVSP